MIKVMIPFLQEIHILNSMYQVHHPFYFIRFHFYKSSTHKRPPFWELDKIHQPTPDFNLPTTPLDSIQLQAILWSEGTSAIPRYSILINTCKTREKQNTLDSRIIVLTGLVLIGLWCTAQIICVALSIKNLYPLG